MCDVFTYQRHLHIVTGKSVENTISCMKHEYCRFLILPEYLIPGFNGFESNRKNIKS